MKKFFLFLSVLSSYLSYAQDQTVQNLKTEASKGIAKDPTDTAKKTWKTGGVVSFNLSQGSLSNWAAGGDKFSLSFNTFLNGHAYYQKGKNSWDNNLDINIGYVKTTSLGTRKNDDRFDLLSKYGYALNSKLKLSFLGNMRSQFFKGYAYPEGLPKVYSSKAFAPAYLILSPGLDYTPFKNVSIFASLATARWVIVSDTALSTLYGVDAGKKSKFEFGAYTSINYVANIGKIVSYKGRLDLYSNYRHKPENIDLYMTNLFAAKLSKAIAITYSLALIYDDDVKQFGDNSISPALQLQSLFGVGVLLKM